MIKGIERFLTIGILLLIAYTYSLNNVDYFYKLLILILTILILANGIYYEKLIKLIRKSSLEKITFFIGGVVIVLLVLKMKSINFVAYSLAKDLQEISQKNIDELKQIYKNILYIYMFILGFYIWYERPEKILEKNKQNDYLFSFRKKELEKIKEIINDNSIPSVLINAKMGNGKSKLIESYANENPEIIYLKLPLVKNSKELKKVLFKEIQSIFLKYDIENKFLNNFSGKVSALKTNFFEIGLEKSSNNWENIKKLKEGLLKIEKKTRIIIVLDDIERECDFKKVEDVVLFLGELSEYFRDTRVTILFLVNYEYIENNCFKNKIFLEKYFRYELKLKEPTIFELSYEDMKKVFDEIIEKGEKEKEIYNEKYIKLNIWIIKSFFQQLRTKSKYEKINENFRNLTRVVNKIIFYKDILKLSKLYYVSIIFFTISEVFKVNEKLDDKEYKVLKEEFFKIMLEAMKFNIEYIHVYFDISNIEKIYFEGEFISKDIELNIDKIIKVFMGENLEKPLEISILEEEIVSDYIGNDVSKLEIALKKNMIKNKTVLSKKLININVDINLSKDVKEIIKEIYLSREYTDFEEYEDRLNAEKNDLYYIEREVLSAEEIMNSEKIKIIRKLKEIKIFDKESDIVKVEKLLDEDIRMRIIEDKNIEDNYI